MICEYALDPEAIPDWRVFRHVALGFGFSQGRVFARYPKDWRRRAYQRIKELDQTSRKNIETWLADVAGSCMVNSRQGCQYEQARRWLDNALAEHRRQSFRAIISDHPDAEDPPVLNVGDVDAGKTTWQVKQQFVIARQAASFEHLISPLVAYAQHIRIVDPYFTADPDQLRILRACLCCFDNIGERTIAKLELHVSGSKVQGGTVSYIEQQYLRTCAPPLPKLAVVRWQPNYIHNRFILTNYGGCMLGDSLRQDESRPDQITLLEDITWKVWWRRFDPEENSHYLAP